MRSRPVSRLDAPATLSDPLDAVFARVILAFCRREKITTLPPDVLAFLEETAREAIMNTTPDEPIEVPR